MLRDFVELIRQTPLGALPSYAGQPVAQGVRYSFRLGLARKLGECLSKLLCFRVSNVDSHLELYVKTFGSPVVSGDLICVGGHGLWTLPRLWKTPETPGERGV